MEGVFDLRPSTFDLRMRQRIAVLGSTGSIGLSTLDIARAYPEHFSVEVLSAHGRIDILERQIEEFKPRVVCVVEARAADRIQKTIPRGTKLLAGVQGLEAAASQEGIDKIVLAVSGSAALAPLWSAVRCGKKIALANKEALVMAGPLIISEARRSAAQILPVDSEQSAIWQCLDGRDETELRRIYLTASGGPFRMMESARLKSATIADVLNHPRWKMGAKITVDSATLMNKGLELIEAMFLFGVPHEKIKILIHPEAVIHSMAEFIDGVVMAQMSAADMRIPIQYALTYPRRLRSGMKPLDFCKMRELHFEEPDYEKFPCLALAGRAAADLGTAPAVLNAANEAAVEAFLRGQLAFILISRVVEAVLDDHRLTKNPSLPEIMEADAWARREAETVIKNFASR